MSNVGKWDDWYSNLQRSEPQTYGDDDITYVLGAKFLADCKSVEDWGCGRGFMRTLIAPDAYVGVDGSQTPHADVIDDLAHRLSNPEGLFVRHVLEHNVEWASILKNASQSAQKKICVVLFTPLAQKTEQIAWNGIGVPDISFEINEILSLLTDKFNVTWNTLQTATQYGEETIIYGERR